jgi:hypothetical protein
MSEIPFVNQLGDAIEAAAGRTLTPARRRRRVRHPWRLSIVFAVLALGGAATADELLSGSTQLAATSISCLAGSGNQANGSYDIQTAGRTPAQACSAVLHRPAETLVACDSTRAGVVVYESDGTGDQCQRLGLSLLPAGYEAADLRVHQLVLALGRLYAGQDCTAPATFAQEVDGLLSRLGFAGWHAQVQATPGSSAGACAQFPGTGSSVSDPAAAIDGHSYPPGGHDLVMIEAGSSRSVLAAFTTLVPELDQGSASRCFTLSSLRAFVTARVAAQHLPVAFTSARLPAGTAIGDARGPRYEAGCAVVGDVGVAPDGRSIAVTLTDRSAPAPSANGSPATAPAVASAPVRR